MNKEYKQAIQWALDGKEVQVNRIGWTTCSLEGVMRHILNDSGNLEFRLKPRTITVNGREVQAGEVVAPASYITYWHPSVARLEMIDSASWDGGDFDRRCLERGLVHLTKEAAIAHAKAMLNID